MTLVAGALLGSEAVPSLLFAFSFFAEIGFLPFLISSALGLVVGLLLGVALLRQGGISVPTARERGATRGALVGLVVGVLPVVLLSSSWVGMLGFFSLVGLAIGRTFDTPSRQAS